MLKTKRLVNQMFYMNSFAPVAIPCASAKQTELCLSAPKNMRSDQAHKVYTTYLVIFINENDPTYTGMKKEFLTQTERGKTKITENDDNWNLLLYKANAQEV